ncbi:MAG: hypothetical protein QOF24_236 [Verrucomicrobiota bacterium]|jgi:Tfp pilus assembly protein PilE
MKRQTSNEKGSTLVVTIIVVATLLVLLGVAVDYSTQVSRNTQRNRKTALAMEIADGHLESLYTNWRNIYRSTWVTYGLNTGGSDYSVCGTNFFATTAATPSVLATPLPGMNPATTPPVIPTPSPSNFGPNADYQVTQYRIQAVDPMINLDASGNAMVESGSKGGGNLVALAPNVQPPGAYGPNLGPYGYYYPYSYYYLAAADVTVPTTTGTVTAKVRRVFEKKFDLPWTYALFFVDDLEFQPSSTFTVTGPIHTNGSLYIGSNNFTIASPTYAAPTPNPTSGRIEYGGDYVNGYHPKDPRYPGSGFTTPSFAKSDSTLTLSDCPPSQVSPYLPFGWNLTLNSGDVSANNDGYREIIEPPKNYPIPPSTDVDPLANIRYYNQAGIKVIINSTAATTGAATNTIRVFRPDATYPLDASKIVECTSGSSGNDKNIYDLIISAVKTNMALYDAREVVNVRITELDVSKIAAACTHGGSGKISGFNGVLYISDMTPAYDNSSPPIRQVISSPQARLGSTDGTSGGTLVSTSERAIRLVNGWSLPLANAQDSNVGGLTVVSINPVYIKGNYNTAAAASPAPTPPSNVTVTSAPVAGSYVRLPSAVVADAINVLSGNWTDANSTSSITSGGYNVANPRSAINTTINTALVSGIVPSGNGNYSGGGEGFIRMQEDWRTQNFVYYGSMSQLFKSAQGNTGGSASGNWFKNPNANRWFYDYATFSDGAPPGNLLIAAYLQQQRWYQVY